MATSKKPPKEWGSQKPSSTDSASLQAFIEANQKRKVHRKCLICEQPQTVLDELDTLIKLKSGGSLPHMTLPMVCGYLAMEHQYTVTWQALRNHVTLCRGAQWVS